MKIESINHCLTTFNLSIYLMNNINKVINDAYATIYWRKTCVPYLEITYLLCEKLIY